MATTTRHSIPSLADARSAAETIRAELDAGNDVIVTSPLCATTAGRAKLRQHLRYGGLTGPQADSLGLEAAAPEKEKPVAAKPSVRQGRTPRAPETAEDTPTAELSEDPTGSEDDDEGSSKPRSRKKRGRRSI